jgi:hypothetical protein
MGRVRVMGISELNLSWIAGSSVVFCSLNSSSMILSTTIRLATLISERWLCELIWKF